MRTSGRTVPSSRGAFTLVEVLVVIGIIGIVIGLLLPAVQKVRGLAQRSRCANNMRQLAIALLNYESSNKVFPYYYADRGNGPTWVTNLLPYVEHHGLHKGYDFNLAWHDPANQAVTSVPIQILLCPTANPNRAMKPTASTTFAVIDYMPNMGLGDDLMASGLVPAVSNNEYCGAIVPRPVYNKNTMQWGTGSPTCLTDMSDGVSQTIVLNEVAGAPELWQAGKYVSSYETIAISLMPPYPAWASPQHWMQLNGYDPTGTVAPGTCAVNCTNQQEVYSFHGGGANIAFVDAHVRFVKQDISVPVMAALVSRYGGEALADADY